MKMINSITKVTLAALLAFIISCPAAALEKVATLMRVEGEFEILGPGETQWRQGEKLDAIYLDTKIKTGRKSEGTLLWDQGHSVTIEENSILIISKTFLRGSVEKTELNLEKGKLIAVARKLESMDSAFEVRTAIATCGVRGTTFAVASDAQDSRFEILEGHLDIVKNGEVQRLDKLQFLEIGSKKAGKPQEMSDYERRWLLYYADEATIASTYVGGINAVYGERSHGITEENAERYNQSSIVNRPWYHSY